MVLCIIVSRIHFYLGIVYVNTKNIVSRVFCEFIVNSNNCGEPERVLKPSLNTDLFLCYCYVHGKQLCTVKNPQILR